MARKKKFEKRANPWYESLIAKGEQPNLVALEEALDRSAQDFYEISKQCFLLTNSPREEGKAFKGVKELFAELNQGKQRVKSDATLSKWNKTFEAFALVGNIQPERYNDLYNKWTVAARAASFLLKRQDQSVEQWFEWVLECTEQEIAAKIAELEGKEPGEITTIGSHVKLMIRKVQAQMMEEFGLRLSQDQILEFRLSPLLGHTPEDVGLREAWAKALGETPNSLLLKVREYDQTYVLLPLHSDGTVNQKQLKALQRWLKGKVVFKKYELEPCIRFYLNNRSQSDDSEAA